MSRTIKLITVTKAPFVAHHGYLKIANHCFPCSLGKTGVSPFKQEGDGATPTGMFRILGGYFRKDRFAFPKTSLPLKPIMPDDGWCDDVESPLYNQAIKTGSKWRHEKMWRKDQLYDVCLILDYNIAPRKRGSGSAIFLHIAPAARAATQGCVAIDRNHMEFVLRLASTHTLVNIRA